MRIAVDTAGLVAAAAAWDEATARLAAARSVVSEAATVYPGHGSGVLDAPLRSLGEAVRFCLSEAATAAASAADALRGAADGYAAADAPVRRGQGTG